MLDHGDEVRKLDFGKKLFGIADGIEGGLPQGIQAGDLRLLHDGLAQGRTNMSWVAVSCGCRRTHSSKASEINDSRDGMDIDFFLTGLAFVAHFIGISLRAQLCTTPLQTIGIRMESLILGRKEDSCQ
jgi:hypothetical protein